MLRLLLFLSLFTIATNAMAQAGAAPVTTKEKPAASQIDYEQPGAPMPPLSYLLYYDTSKKNKMAITAANKDTVGLSSHHARKKKKHREDPMAEGVKELTNDDLNNRANLFVMIFNPNCSHCEDETIMLEHNSALFKKSKLLLLASPIMKSYINDFISYTHANQYSSFMYLGIDNSDFTKKVFLYKALPQINIYNKKRRLIRAFTGEVAIDSLKKYIQ